MKTETKQSTNPDKKLPMLKMRELTEASGVSKATILYYINVGLLPKPVKTNTNVSFYPPSMVEKIRFIKQLQTTHRMSLDQIKNIINARDKGKEVSLLIEMNEVVFGQSDGVQMDKAAFCTATDLSMDELGVALKNQFLVPREEGIFDSEDIAVGCVLKRCYELGLQTEDISYYPEMAKKIVDQEMKIRDKLTRKKPFDDVLSITLELTKIARSFRGYIIDRTFQREAAKQQFVEENRIKNGKKAGSS